MAPVLIVEKVIVNAYCPIFREHVSLKEKCTLRLQIDYLTQDSNPAMLHPDVF